MKQPSASLTRGLVCLAAKPFTIARPEGMAPQGRRPPSYSARNRANRTPLQRRNRGLCQGRRRCHCHEEERDGASLCTAQSRRVCPPDAAATNIVASRGGSLRGSRPGTRRLTRGPLSAGRGSVTIGVDGRKRMFAHTVHRISRRSALHRRRRRPMGQSFGGTDCMDVPRAEICCPSRNHVKRGRDERTKQRIG